MSSSSRGDRGRESAEEGELRRCMRGNSDDTHVARCSKRRRSSSSSSRSRSSSRRDRSSNRSRSHSSEEASSSSSSSVSSFSSSSDSDAAARSKRAKRERRDEEKETRRKRDKKKKKKDAERKKRRDSEKKREKGNAVKKMKHHKKKKKKNKRDFYSSKSATEQYGKYGLLQESDMWKKRPEFSLWLIEVKGKNIETLPSWEEKELFKDYLEDFNTATLPSEKYYNLELYEAKQRMKRVNLEEHRELTDFNDEARRKNEILALREQRRAAETQQRLQTMRDERDKVQDMRQQQLLRSKVETLYRLGANTEAKKLAESLQPAK